MGAGNRGSILVHVGTNDTTEEGTTDIVNNCWPLLKRTKQARMVHIFCQELGPGTGAKSSRRMVINLLVLHLCKEETV